MLLQCWKMPNLVSEYKTIFLGKRGTSQKVPLYTEVSHEIVLKSVKSLDSIF